MFELPRTFAVWRCAQEYSAAIVQAVLVNQNTYRFHILESLQTLVGEATCIPWEDDTWLEDTSKKVMVKRSSGVLERTHEVEMVFLKYVICTPLCFIPVFHITDKFLILGDRFIDLLQQENRSYRMYMRPNTSISYPPLPLPRTPSLRPEILRGRRLALQMADIAAREYLEQTQRQEQRQARTFLQLQHRVQPESEPSILQQTPSHILQGFLESILEKKELCPIKMNEMKKETICTTPCGHAMSYEPAVLWLKEHTACPVCRKTCNVSELYRYTA
jgi:hypothetical protein